MHSSRLALALALTLGALPAALAAADRSPAPAAPVEVRHLLRLRGDAVMVHYTPGALDRAAHVQRRLEVLTDELASWRVPVAVGVLVLSPEDWAQSLPHGDPGLPFLAGPLWLATPARGDQRTLAVWQAAAVPLPSLGQPMLGTAEEAASLALADVLLLPTLARSWLDRRQLLTGDPEIDTFSSHLVALAAAERGKLVEAPAVEQAWRGLAAREPAGPAAELVREARARVVAQELIAAHPGAVHRWLRDRVRSGLRFEREALVGRFPELAAALATAAAPAAPVPAPAAAPR